LELDEFLEFTEKPENETIFCEMIDGHIYMTEGSSFNHASVCAHISSEIHAYLRGKDCSVVSGAYVCLFDGDIADCKNVFRPDILIGCDKEKMTDNRGYEGTPKFVAEVVSKSSTGHDYLTKLHSYIKYGVKEYWIVDMFKNRILVYINGDDRLPQEVQSYSFDDIIESRTFEGLRIDFSEILKIIK
jgi:Uma2 family endonuclease